jgi:hypothetical protein
MANEITTAREQFQSALVSAGIRVSEFIPERVTPPIVIINSRSPYLAPNLFGEFDLNLELVLVAATATNKQAQEKLEDTIEAVLQAVAPLAWVQLNEVGQPYAMQVNNAEYLSSNVSVTLQITI